MAEPPGRLLVVGCPRSGTTMVQAALSCHPDLISIPESFYFEKIWGRMSGRRRWGIVSPRAARHALRRVGADVRTVAPDATVATPSLPSARRYGVAFVELLDEACRSTGRAAWMDKSPGHLRCIGQILRVAPDAVFVHVVRDGSDTVQSFFRECVRAPELWVGQVLPGRRSVDAGSVTARAELLEAIARRWNEDIARTRSLADGSAHLVVRYDDVVSDPDRAFGAVCDLVGIGRLPGELRPDRADVRVIGHRSDRPHMEAATRVLGSRTSTVEGTTLTVSERQLVAELLAGGGQLDRVLG